MQIGTQSPRKPITNHRGGGEVKGTVAEVKTDGDLTIETKGKHVTKKGEPDNAAVRTLTPRI